MRSSNVWRVTNVGAYTENQYGQRCLLTPRRSFQELHYSIFMTRYTRNIQTIFRFTFPSILKHMTISLVDLYYRLFFQKNFQLKKTTSELYPQHWYPMKENKNKSGKKIRPKHIVFSHLLHQIQTVAAWFIGSSENS